MTVFIIGLTIPLKDQIKKKSVFQKKLLEAVFPIRWFICGRPLQYPPHAAISSRVSHTHTHTHTSVTLAQYLASFRPLWLLFFHNRYILTNLATFQKKTLVIVLLEDVTSTAPRGRGLTLPAVSNLSASILCSERQRNTDSSINNLQNSVSKHLTLTDCLDF